VSAADELRLVLAGATSGVDAGRLARRHGCGSLLRAGPGTLQRMGALPALIDRSAVPLSRIREVCFHQAKVAGQTHGPAVMILSAFVLGGIGAHCLDCIEDKDKERFRKNI